MRVLLSSNYEFRLWLFLITVRVLLGLRLPYTLPSLFLGKDSDLFIRHSIIDMTLGANACFTASNVISVTVNTLPLITANVTSSVVCQGSSITLFGVGGVSYVWSGGVVNNVVFAPTSSANYTVTGTGANGCQATASKSIVVNALPGVTAVASNSVLCYGSSLINKSII